MNVKRALLFTALAAAALVVFAHAPAHAQDLLANSHQAVAAISGVNFTDPAAPLASHFQMASNWGASSGPPIDPSNWTHHAARAAHSSWMGGDGGALMHHNFFGTEFSLHGNPKNVLKVVALRFG